MISEMIDREILKLRRRAGNSIRILGWTWYMGFWRKIYKVDGEFSEVKFKDPLDACKWLRGEISTPKDGQPSKPEASP